MIHLQLQTGGIELGVSILQRGQVCCQCHLLVLINLRTRPRQLGDVAKLGMEPGTSDSRCIHLISWKRLLTTRATSAHERALVSCDAVAWVLSWLLCQCSSVNAAHHAGLWKRAHAYGRMPHCLPQRSRAPIQRRGPAQR
jgi:hypothetical protein